MYYVLEPVVWQKWQHISPPDVENLTIWLVILMPFFISRLLFYSILWPHNRMFNLTILYLSQDKFHKIRLVKFHKRSYDFHKIRLVFYKDSLLLIQITWSLLPMQLSWVSLELTLFLLYFLCLQKNPSVFTSLYLAKLM